MSMTTYEMARVLEQLEDSPEKIMFGKLLNELGSLSSERIQSAARQVPLDVLRDLVFQFSKVIDSRQSEGVQELAKEIAKQGISANDLLDYLNQKSS